MNCAISLVGSLMMEVIVQHAFGSVERTQTLTKARCEPRKVVFPNDTIPQQDLPTEICSYLSIEALTEQFHACTLMLHSAGSLVC